MQCDNIIRLIKLSHQLRYLSLADLTKLPTGFRTMLNSLGIVHKCSLV